MSPAPSTVSRRTSGLVRFGDRAARLCITFGGLATIGAVGLVCVFLFWVVMPLLGSASVAAAHDVARRDAGVRILHQRVDPYGRLCCHLLGDGRVVGFTLDTGAVLGEQKVFDPAEAPVVTAHGSRVLLGRHDGSVRFLEIGFSAELLQRDTEEPAALGLEVGQFRQSGDVLVERVAAHAVRRQRLQVALEEPVAIATAPILAADFSPGADAQVIAVLTAEGVLSLQSARKQMNYLENREVVTLSGGKTTLTDLGLLPGAGPGTRLLLSGTGDNVYLLWPDGRGARIDARDFEAPRLAERLDLFADDASGSRPEMTAVGFTLGKGTLAIGDARGRLRLFFRTRPPTPAGSDGWQLTLVHELLGPPSPVTSLGASELSRLLLIGHADGRARLVQTTSTALVADVRLPSGQPVLAASLGKEERIVLADRSQVGTWTLQPGHPEATLAAVFLPVWYETATRPEHVWQSTSGSDDFEPKFGLWPLVFGTLKGTLYCMLLGVPLALLAAIYTSEFLHPRRRAKVKPLIELMASLPSVVLGFLAALVFAPLVESHLVTILAMFVTLPLVLLAGAQLWQAAPGRLRPVLERGRLLAVLLAVPLAIPLAAMIGRGIEQVFFRAGTPGTTSAPGEMFRAWLAAETKAPDDPTRGSAFGGWFFLFLPAGVMAWVLGSHALAGGLHARANGPVRLLIGTVATIAVSALAAATVTALGFDLRGNVVGTYVQRNSLVVGFAMGFAIVPIIYTIAEDALTAVPDHLRAASLGAGATPWQTAVRVVLPTAMSGIFSAVMVGLGRAVGETMIVLMATGITPILDLNVFNGFRTLSANIAVELPEAVRDSTHYRLLFLAAFCLFAMTFVLNTIAELVRQRFRKRAYQL